jgi:hypothetical protein
MGRQGMKLLKSFVPIAATLLFTGCGFVNALHIEPSDIIDADTPVIETKSFHFSNVHTTRQIYAARPVALVYEKSLTQPGYRFYNILGVTLMRLFDARNTVPVAGSALASIYTVYPKKGAAFSVLAVRSSDYRRLELYYPLSDTQRKRLEKIFDKTLPPIPPYPFSKIDELPFSKWNMHNLITQRIVVRYAMFGIAP